MAGEALMLARLFLTAAIITASVVGVSGQSGTADGVAALARGDYRRAVEILRPIAEELWANDTAALFFMAGLYDIGRGVPADPLRACALYQRATSDYDSPFGRQAAALFRAASSRGLEFNEECQLLANVGFDHGFEPVTFHLGPGHFTDWTLSSATVTYEGRTKREQMGYAQPGARFLALEHTALATGPARSLTRHFVEVFVWQPAAARGPWALRWHLVEIVRDQIVRIDTPELVTVSGDEPPSRETFDVRAYAALRVDDEGNPEWAVLKGPLTATERIESESERREVRDRELARAEAMKRVDWSRKYDVHREPTMMYADAAGCGSAEVYGWTADRAEAVVVRANVGALNPSTKPATFDLGRQSADLSIEAWVYDAPQRQFNFCTDVVLRSPLGSDGPEMWRAVGGTITIELSPPGVRARQPYQRRATVTLSNIVLRNAAGRTVTVRQPVKLVAMVGGMFG
jgi:hypothetical protein